MADIIFETRKTFGNAKLLPIGCSSVSLAVEPAQSISPGKTYAHLFDIKKIQGWTVIRLPTSDSEEPLVNTWP